MKYKSIIKGTFILSFTGIVNRALGFYYKIYLKDIIGAGGLGIYQMIFPLSVVALSVCSTGISVATRKLIATPDCKKDKHSYLLYSIILSSVLSVICGIILYTFAPLLSHYVLNESKCLVLIQTLAFSIPFSALHNVIVSYFYGEDKALIPSISILIEQIIRIGSVLFLCKIRLSKNLIVNENVAVSGIILGEIAALIFCILCINTKKIIINATAKAKVLTDIIYLSIPVSANSLTLSLIHSIESMMLPTLFMLSGIPKEDSYITYAILFGMTFPLAFFPQAIVVSFATLLISRIAGCGNDMCEVNKRAKLSIFASFVAGILAFIFFLIFGSFLGNLLFHEELVGKYLRIFAFVSPCMYMSITIDSILNGLGKTKSTFYLNSLSHIIRLLFLVIIVPKYGVLGFCCVFILSEIINMLLHLYGYRHFIA